MDLAQVVCSGEALIDFVSQRSGVDLAGAPGFEKAPGGAPANVAVALARLGTPSAFMGKVGDDPFGHFLADTFAAAGVSTASVVFDPAVKTGLAFVSLMTDGERDFLFYRDPSADMMLRPDEIDEALIRGARAFHFGSITRISEPSRSATDHAIAVASAAGLLISYDPNLRMSLWDTPEHARAEMLAAMPQADVVKVCEEELEFLLGTTDLAAGARSLLDTGPSLVAVTRGAAGCTVWNHVAHVDLPGFRVDTVDTTGAGDGFVAGALHCLLAAAGPTEIARLNERELREVFTFANAVGALATTRKGAIPAMPDLASAKALAGTRA